MAQGYTKELPIDTDEDLTLDSDYVVPSQQAVKAYVDGRLSATNATDLTDGGETSLHTHDHGALNGLSDDDHTQYLLASGTRAGSTSQAQDFGATGLKADVVAESTAAAGVLVDGNLAIDSTLHSLFYLPKYENEYQYFNDNDSSYPAGWTETVAASTTNTNKFFNTWWFYDTGGAQFDYRYRTSLSLNSTTTFRSIRIGPIFFSPQALAQSVTFTMAAHGETTSSSGIIDTSKFINFQINYDTTAATWRTRYAWNDGTTSTSYTNISGWPIQNQFYVALMLYPATGLVRAAISPNRVAWYLHTTGSLGADLFYGNINLRFTLTSGGVASFAQFYVAGWDSIPAWV